MLLYLLIALQAVQVAILWLHDWLPVPPLNDVRRVQAEDSRGRLIGVTVIQSLPFTIGLGATIVYARTGHPAWVFVWLWVSYLILFAGEVQAWWAPYLGKPQPERAARYAKMFGGTHAFLPARNGVTPNTLHCILHGATAATVLVLAARTVLGAR